MAWRGRRHMALEVGKYRDDLLVGEAFIRVEAAA
jgi:hypothetical protein